MDRNQNTEQAYSDVRYGTLQILIHGGKALRGRNKAYYANEVSEMIRRTVKKNKTAEPIKSETICETCYDKQKLEHPITGFCFNCGTDNWRSLNPYYQG